MTKRNFARSFFRFHAVLRIPNCCETFIIAYMYLINNYSY